MLLLRTSHDYSTDGWNSLHAQSNSMETEIMKSQFENQWHNPTKDIEI